MNKVLRHFALLTSTKQTEANMGAVIEATGPSDTAPLNPRRFVLERCDDSKVGGSQLVEPGERWAVDLRNDFEYEDEIVLRVARIRKRWELSSSVSLPDCFSTSIQALRS